jgi:hypothetical protein
MVLNRTPHAARRTGIRLIAKRALFQGAIRVLPALSLRRLELPASGGFFVSRSDRREFSMA